MYVCGMAIIMWSLLILFIAAGTSSDTLKVDVLCDELSTVSDWLQLGLKLGVPDYKLEEIQRNHPFEGCSRWKLEVLKLWLQIKPNASWINLVRVLQQMGERTLAKRIRQKYTRRGSSKLQFSMQSCPYTKEKSHILIVIWLCCTV